MTVHRKPQLPTGSGSSSGVNLGGPVASTPEQNRDLGDKFESLLGPEEEDAVPKTADERAEAQRYSTASLFAMRSQQRNAALFRLRTSSGK